MNFRVADTESAIQLANDTTFGLGASAWTRDRDEAERFAAELDAGMVFINQQVVSDPHSPDVYRVNGTIRNVDGWYSAFDIKPGDPLYLAPADRVHIW